MPKAAATKVSKPVAPVKEKKAKKDPNAPKGASSAYIFFGNEMRDKIAKEMPELSFGEKGKEAGARWKKLTEAEKKPYQDMADKDKARAQREKAAYAAKGGAGASKKPASGKKGKAAPADEEEEEEEEDEDEE